jgi:SET domain-containing protein
VSEPVPPEVWVDERVVVAASAIHGRGLFAAGDLDEGTIVVRLGGRRVTTDELTRLMDDVRADPAAPYVDTITLDEDVHLVLPSGSMAHFGNHSCDPNLWHSSALELATRRAIAAGTELTLDYGTNSGAPRFDMDCACASRTCRGRITGDDWRRPELQRRYGAHWTPALLARIRRASDQMAGKNRGGAWPS